MWEWDNKAMMEAISLHDRVMRMHLTKFDGYEVATEGDAFLIAFHTPGNAVAYATATNPARCHPPPPPPPNPPTPRQCGNLCIFASHQVSHVYLVFLHGMCSLVCFTAVLCPDKFQLLPASLLVLTPVVGCNLVQQGGQGGVSIQEPGDHATGLSDSDSQPMTVSQ